jgi:hypothetical protein
MSGLMPTCSNAAHPGLYFVEYQEQLVAIAPVAHSLQVIGARHDDAALALDRFDHHGDSFVAPRVIERREIVEGHESETGHHRLKALMVALLAGRADGCECASVERSERGQNLEASATCVTAPPARELNGSLIRLGTRISQKDFSVAEMIRQSLDQSRRRLGMKNVGNVRELFRLLLDRAHDARISMTEAGDGEPAEEIEIAVAVGIVKIRAVAAGEREREASVDIDLVAMGEFYYLGVVHRDLPPLCALRALSLKAETLARCWTTSVPMPERVKISSRTACLLRPSIIWVFATPLLSASIQHSTFGIIPS